MCLVTLLCSVNSFTATSSRPKHKISNKIASAPRAESAEVTGLSSASGHGVVVASLTLYSALPIMPALAAENNLVLNVGRPVLDSFVNIMSLLMIIRTVLSWYPKTDLRAFPYVIAVWPTEPLLAPIRSIVPPAFGVDVSSLVWVGILSFVREVFTGQQGILTLMEKYPDTF